MNNIPTMAPLDDGAVAKHRQLRDRLVELADSLPDNAPVPSERELMEHFGISRGTVRTAINALISEGVLSRSQGKGTYVARRRLLTPVYLASFTKDMTARGLQPATTVLGLERVESPVGVRAFLGSAMAWRVERLRSADGAPIAHEVAYLSAALVPSLHPDDLQGSVYELLSERFDVPIDAAEQTVWARSADEQLAQLLGIEIGEAVMVFDRQSTSRGRPIEAVTSHYRADRYSIRMSLAAGPSPRLAG
jgi:GntR family transcriptional regulator